MAAPLSSRAPGDRAYVVPAPSRGSVLGDPELTAVRDALAGTGPLSGGMHRKAFEAALAQLLGCRHAMTTTSGTVALELAIRALDLRPDDHVVVTPQTFHATAQPLLDTGADVTFCDVDPQSLNMDPDALAAVISDRTRAILLVHYGGEPADMSRIMQLARAHDALVIEDCAHALGADTPAGRPGSLADIGCFSFHATKNITTLGEGGLVTTSHDDLATRIDLVRHNRSDTVHVPRTIDPELVQLAPWLIFADDLATEVHGVRRAGTNAVLSEPAAAAGLAQLERLDTLVARRTHIADRLRAVVDESPGFTCQHGLPGSVSAHHLFTFFCELGAPARLATLRALDEAGIEAQLRYIPLHLTPDWRSAGHGPGECPVAEADWFNRHLNLPCHPGLTDAQLDYLESTVRDVLEQVAHQFPVHALST